MMGAPVFSTYDVELILFCCACTVQPTELKEGYSFDIVWENICSLMPIAVYAINVVLMC